MPKHEKRQGGVCEESREDKAMSSVVERGARVLSGGGLAGRKEDQPATPPWLSLAQVPFWNGCNEDEHCVPDLLLDARSDLPTAM